MNTLMEVTRKHRGKQKWLPYDYSDMKELLAVYFFINFCKESNTTFQLRNEEYSVGCRNTRIWKRIKKC